MRADVRALLLVATLLVAGTATAGCLDRLQGAFDSAMGREPPGPPGDTAITPVKEPLTPSYVKNLSLEVLPGHVRVIVKADLTSTMPDSPFPVKSPGQVKVTLTDAKGVVRKVFDLGAPPAPVYTMTVELTPERDGAFPEGLWNLRAEGRGLSNGQQGATFSLEARATATPEG